MNTGQKNTHGRTIYRGPRGGEYVLGPAGLKIRSFTKAPAAAAPVPGPGNTGQRNILGRVIYRGPRGGEYVLGPGGKKIRTFTKAVAPGAAPNTAERVRAAAAPAAARAAAALAKKLSKMLKLSNNEYINKSGIIYNGQAKMKPRITHPQLNNAATRAYNKSPKFLYKNAIPYVSGGRPNTALMTKLKLKNSTLFHHAKMNNGTISPVSKKIYFNKKGELYFISLNGRKHRVDHYPWNRQTLFKIKDPKDLRRLKRLVGIVSDNYPRSAIPPASPAPRPAPPPRRSSPALLENMMNQIYNGGRGSNINAGRYTLNERNTLAKRLGASIAHFKRQRNAKKVEAAIHRESMKVATVPENEKQLLRTLAAAANERVGYYNNAVRAYTRGLRAVKPLTGAVTPRARAMPNTPNRSTPAPANVNVNAIYMPLNKPHLVVKTPGAGTIYLNPNTFTGFMKNAGRVTIAPANVRNWLRMARRDFPNEALFRHPLAAKNVTASHIRFSRG